MSTATNPQTRTHARPRSVVILIFLQVLQSLGLVGYSVYLVSFGGWSNREDPAHILSFVPFVIFSEAASGIVFMILGVLTFIVAISLYLSRQWAWLAAMSIQGLGLLAGIWVYLHGAPNYVGMALGILLVLYLNHHEVEEYFHPGRGERA